MLSREEIKDLIIGEMRADELKLEEAKRRVGDANQNEYDENDLNSITLEELPEDLIKRENPWYVAPATADVGNNDYNNDYEVPKYSRDYVARSGQQDFVSLEDDEGRY